MLFIIIKTCYWLKKLNAYIDQRLEEFRPQLSGYFPEATVVNCSIFNQAIQQNVIPLGGKLPKMGSLYLGTTSLFEHLDNFVVHMALNPNHDVLKYRLFEITLGQHARTWYVNLPQSSIRGFSELVEKFMAHFSSCEPI